MQRDRSSTHHRSADDNTKHTHLSHVTSSLVFFCEDKDISFLRHVIDLNQLLMLGLHAVDHDDLGGAGRMIEIREMTCGRLAW